MRFRLRHRAVVRRAGARAKEQALGDRPRSWRRKPDDAKRHSFTTFRSVEMRPTMPARTLFAGAGSFPAKRCLYHLDAPTIACRSKPGMQEDPMNKPTLMELWLSAAALAMADCADAGSNVPCSRVAPATSFGPGLTLHRSGLNGGWVRGKGPRLDRFETNEATARTGRGSTDSPSRGGIGSRRPQPRSDRSAAHRTGPLGDRPARAGRPEHCYGVEIVIALAAEAVRIVSLRVSLAYAYQRARWPRRCRGCTCSPSGAEVKSDRPPVHDSPARRFPSNRRRAPDDHNRHAADRLRGRGRHRRVARRGRHGDPHAPAAPGRADARDFTDQRAVAASGSPRADLEESVVMKA
jgi:hypothetical protein